jgi:tetratricopeptide (TPR) repeat protein
LYDSAIILLNKLKSKYPNYRKNDVEEIYEDCYFNIKDYSQSLKYSLTILSRFKSNDLNADDYCVACVFACTRAAKSYLNLGDYNKAILYYDSSQTKYQNKLQFCGNAAMIDKAYQDKDLFYCYIGLKNFTKAIEFATPYFFDSTMIEFIDTSYSESYFNTLAKLFSKKDASNKTDLALNNLTAKLDTLYRLDSTATPSNTWVELFGAKLDFLEEVGRGKETAKMLLTFFPKEYLIQRFKTSLGYRHFKTLE